MVRPAQAQVVRRQLPNGLKLAMAEDHRTRWVGCKCGTTWIEG